MRILITGSTGPLGRHLMEILDDNEILGLTHTESPTTNEFQTNLYKYDSELTKKLDIFKPTHIIHAAAVQNSDPDCYDKNIKMASNIFSYRKRYNSKFIFISSSTVYGDRGSKKICGVEDTMIYGTTDYANSKIDGEFLAKSFKDTLIFRPCAMIDPKSKRGLCYDIVYKLKEGSNQITLMGDEPGSIKPYISAQFAASYIASKINSTGIYNVAPQDNVSVKTVAEIAMKISGKNKSVVWSGAAANFAGDNPVVAMSSDINVSSVDFLKNYFIEMFK